jgi:hypothetical protein
MKKRRRRSAVVPPALFESDRSLLDLVDNVLTRGVVLMGDVRLGLANVDLVYLRLQALLAAADQVFGAPTRARDRRPPPAALRGRVAGRAVRKRRR